MNKGDKVICIKSYDGFLENDICFIGTMTIDEVYIRREINVVSSGGWFLLIDFCTYFITIAEWREEQMKNILDD
jgi:hypothetical protein